MVIGFESGWYFLVKRGMFILSSDKHDKHITIDIYVTLTLYEGKPLYQLSSTRSTIRLILNLVWYMNSQGVGVMYGV
jgi:hypothetical protein